ncbi:MAG: (2Fe-2S)-binding protein [Bacteroidetes bacterium CG12_big_fil_rev_8_21_14_0_65_60_17]|nr:MAG: (2Fe-2S)-binding protein [Bacteroidetes bacterium CG12_big_fil_rev_8_21_14_0_65_60_17]
MSTTHPHTPIGPAAPDAPPRPPAALKADDLTTRPLATSQTIPSAWYTDPEFHAFDRRYVLERSWQYVGPASRTAEPFSYISDFVAGNPVVVVRDRGGTLRAFYNVCKHRGGPLVTAPCGTARMLQCQYHGWTYRLDGMLRGVPRFDRTELFDKRDYGLTEIAVATWEGLVFVCLRPDETPPLAEIMDGIRERIEASETGHPAAARSACDLASFQFAARDTYDVNANWKVYVDNYLEGYHLPLVHPELCDLLDFGTYNTETFDWYSLQHSPIRADSDACGPANEQAYYYFVFPNLMLNILPGRLQVNRVDQVRPNACSVVFDYYYGELPTAADRAAADRTFSDRVQAEDIDICEHVQRGLESNAYDRGRFSYDLEGGVHHFQTRLKRAYHRATSVRPE